MGVVTDSIKEAEEVRKTQWELEALEYCAHQRLIAVSARIRDNKKLTKEGLVIEKAKRKVVDQFYSKVKTIRSKGPITKEDFSILDREFKDLIL